uniref:Reverse transcriptase Ty1/copia-type domain-containing protein n=1 Tax=Fagus sylvatica TaxID=28930 RepID=A0A2N9ETY9_FAGSY
MLPPLLLNMLLAATVMLFMMTSMPVLEFHTDFRFSKTTVLNTLNKTAVFPPHSRTCSTHITSTLKAYKLLDMVDGSYPCPEMYNRDTSGNPILNFDFIQWDTKDQALISMICATLSPLALALVIAMRTRNDSISFEELHVLMLGEEKSLNKNTESSKDSLHLAMVGQGPKGPTGNTPMIQFNPQSQSNRGGRGGRFNNYRGGRGGRNFNSNRGANLQQARDYNGNDAVTVGNGQQLPITHIVDYLDVEPPSFSIASALTPWVIAMEDEFSALHRQDNLTSTMPSYMAFSRKMSTWLSPKASLIHSGQIMCANSISPYMDSSRHQKPGLKDLPPNLKYLAFMPPLPILPYSHSRPDLSFAVNQVCQFMHSPTDTHLIAAKRILRYIKGSLSSGLLFQPDSLNLQAYADADWAGDPIDRRSTSGYVVFLGSTPITWVSKKQCTVSRSSTEAEYRSLASATAEVFWIRIVLKDLGLFLPNPPILWCDNLSALALTSNPIFHARTKHIEVNYHFIREKVVRRDVIVKFISTTDQLADILTKCLPSPSFHRLRANLLHPFRPP